MTLLEQEDELRQAAIALLKQQIEAQLDEYEQAIDAYRAWVNDWRSRKVEEMR